MDNKESTMYRDENDLEIQLSISPLKIRRVLEEDLERKESLKYKNKACTVKQVYLKSHNSQYNFHNYRKQ